MTLISTRHICLQFVLVVEVVYSYSLLQDKPISCGMYPRLCSGQISSAFSIDGAEKVRVEPFTLHWQVKFLDEEESFETEPLQPEKREKLK